MGHKENRLLLSLSLPPDEDGRVDIVDFTLSEYKREKLLENGVESVELLCVRHIRYADGLTLDHSG